MTSFLINELGRAIPYGWPMQNVLGRKPKLTEHQKRETINRRDRLGESVREIARSYNVSHSTISRARKRSSRISARLRGRAFGEMA